ncbi:HlyD family secretion protein [Flavobacterium okayamense]|uniref:Hemolysin n=1 Tax=Flavobacterium okayamense TaxID=2830782 RepID=A0ABN6HSP5_9FLAO|nr:HlyD family efflux transporter periplasmic adaptor subunit [Flavobacterium okayamense]BCY27573.1 hemolysin [Flavobacterium okayamense]
MELQDDLKIYSEEVRDVLNDPPKSIFKWGNTILLGFVLLIFVLAYYIKYPDIIRGQLLITTQTPPEKLIARTSGKIDKILIQDKSEVKTNTPLAIIENSADYTAVFQLKSVLDTISISKSVFPFEIFYNTNLGDLEAPFALFQKEYIASDLNKQLKPFQVESSAQTFESRQLNERLNLLINQKEINQAELKLQKKDIDRYEQLYKKGIISAQEIEKQRLQYLQAEKAYQSLLSSISQLKSSLNDLNRNSQVTKINENKENVNLERSVLQSFYQLKKALKDWELQYAFIGSINGKVSYLQVWSENQFIQSGETMFSIVPIDSNSFIGKLKAPAQNSGKIKVGQKVNIRLANYPDREFGILEGRVRNISLTPDKDGNLLIDIELPKGLQTSYKKDIEFQQEMIGTADIITEDLRLIERLLYQFRDVFKR